VSQKSGVNIRVVINL